MRVQLVAYTRFAFLISVIKPKITLVHRCLHGSAPRCLADHVVLTSSVGRRSGLRSVDILTLEVLRTRLSFGDRAFSVAGPRARNSLLINVRSAQKTFKSVFISVCVFSTWIRVLTLSGVLVAFFCVRRLKFVILQYIDAHSVTEDEIAMKVPNSKGASRVGPRRTPNAVPRSFAWWPCSYYRLRILTDPNFIYL